MEGRWLPYLFSSSPHKFCFCFHFTIKEHPKA
ncbi:hypothetical protein WN943_018751 [Citrus x changshan-huyou]